ncbi:Quinolinate synthase A [Auxenochlorella protothecoides]|uniref:quinolinate synthase n=2 Tax=Auxenochlorella protothecoides TaxID=3075 RepID=A0A087SN84_AUXPR|nr:Quinolinate synthase A [Auxenochlorella protothecoides]KFM27188.1 Quinolinate synthase A [Auxenochlorella protothecoides]
MCPRLPLGLQRSRLPQRATVAAPRPGFADLMAAFEAAPNDRARSALLLDVARRVSPLDAADRTDANRVLGCTAQVWLASSVEPGTGALRLRAGADSALHAGLANVVLSALDGLAPEAVLAFDASALAALGARWGSLTASRTNGLAALLGAARAAASRALGHPAFPSLLVSARGVAARGAYAEAQAAYLDPAPEAVQALADALAASRVGVVAHFYMDPEVQGVLAAAARAWPHIAISDSLVMADRAVAMARAGCRAVAVLGVDFMAENVRAMLDEAGHQDVRVLRMDAGAIGCSLAEAAEGAAYSAFLARAAAHPSPALHVVYINTSLRTKARAQAAVPTLTCTSSNVVASVLGAFAAVPGVHVWYGPDAYMGRNVRALLAVLAAGPDEAVRAVHAQHSARSVADALPRFHSFQDGMCVVHHMFGAGVCQRVAADYGDAYLAAHFEVPGEMFELALAASRRGAGVVGSTSNILDFIVAKVREEAAAAEPRPKLQFVLGTETGMVTAIVRAVRAELERLPGLGELQVEIVFPVSPDAITTPEQERGAGSASLTLPGGVSLIPGPAGGEGCSSSGGCASCPYMKMNTLSALLDVCSALRDPAREAQLARHEPVPYTEKVAGRSVASLGCETILHMRDFQKEGRLSERLVADVLARKRRA